MANYIGVEKIKLLSNENSGSGTIPDFTTTILGEKFKNGLDEDDGLYINYAPRGMSFPYGVQNQYDRELKEIEYQAVVLENEYLKAIFLPELGGRLYSLFDKVENKELLYKNPVIRFCNLAVRGAWFAGGIEWNCGVAGHTPYTCAPVYAAIDEAKKILRVYEYERVRKVTYQIDFSLPEGSKFLHCRTRVVNTTEEVTPVYWWSNVAVRSRDKKLRTVVPADCAYTNINYTVTKIPMQENGEDHSYPAQSLNSIDYFWKVKNSPLRYMSAIDGQGKGLLQLSTDRLQGRKLFVWGQGKGAQHWQEWLSGEGDEGEYCEIQAGLAPTQYESLPMPPKTAWEWVELYGAISLPPEEVHGDFAKARAAVEGYIAEELSEGYAEKFLKESHAQAITPLEKLICQGSVWGGLENLRREYDGEAPISSHLFFNGKGEEAEPWKALLTSKSFGEQSENIPPISYMEQEEWTQLMEKAVRGKDKNNWFAYYQLGCSYIADGALKKAENRLKKAASLANSPYVDCALAQCYTRMGKKAEAKEIALKVGRDTKDKDIAVFVCKQLFKLQCFEELYAYIRSLNETLQGVPRVRLYDAFAAVTLGRTEEAEMLLEKEGGLQVPDMQECETDLGELYFRILENKAAATGKTYVRKYADVPYRFSFQMIGAE